MLPAFSKILLGSRALRRLSTLVTGLRLQAARRRESERRRRFPMDLTNFEKRFFSQNGEDGILEEIFSRIGTTNRYFVEIGVGRRLGDGETEGNTRHLLEAHGWSGAWIEGSETFTSFARKEFSKWPLQVERAFVDRENIDALFQKLGVPRDLDLLSIDIDGNDYWIWKALAGWKARVVILEYNARFLPGEHWVMPYDPKHEWDASDWFGASLEAFAALGRELGYELVGCDSNGVNAFLVRRDLLADKFCRPGDVPFHYSAPKWNPHFYGSPPTTKHAIIVERTRRAA